ncbi:expression site-associated gene (ESAG) protein, putative; expression site-associated gene 1 (ESAG1) protein, putative [Trypanosoma brucei brucei TREU927]|uniref:Expression site-associated gene (ESAG) protein, putative expression site-associated gene 1 (ESAG1) protein, putative n=1 Tax=Trypanosoma brucei brucei (strain 927/4 GUTat10.1) TaxID=185431 RepID=Q4GY93_TRYB2|nr:expression site-associated gene (ESAG) protein; expression site-associated gene 1 (ESAG1) [Trypanosoma brucei brucei TREU927]CAJ16693.1 expression site-associated gene (ESAG) protein, putative; expression site-associated gene 1 (ESAG1) protein, putative [Trypanosoma brucei brucei TREU927]
MKVTIAELVVLLFSVICIDGKEDNGCTLITDYHGDAPLSESVCYLSCLSNALNKLYSEGERRLFVNEEVYANAFRILDDMEGRAGESVRYLSIISVAMVKENNRLEKLISHGNAMGDLVAKAGGLFAEVNESVRAVRKEIPGALIKVNKYYTAIAEITRTVWDDVKAVESGKHECKDQEFRGVKEFDVTCGDNACLLAHGVSEGALKHYKNGLLEINVMTKSGGVSKCLNLPRNNLYKSGAVNNSNKVLDWRDDADTVTHFLLKLKIRDIFSTLIAPFAAGQPPSALLDMMANITSLYSRFNEVHRSFTSLLFDTNSIDNVKSTNSTI